MVFLQIVAEGRVRSVACTLLRRACLLPLPQGQRRRSQDQRDCDDGRELEEPALASPALHLDAALGDPPLARGNQPLLVRRARPHPVLALLDAGQVVLAQSLPGPASRPLLRPLLQDALSPLA